MSFARTFLLQKFIKCNYLLKSNRCSSVVTPSPSVINSASSSKLSLTGCESITDACVTFSFEINSAYFSVVACVVDCLSVVVDVLRDILGDVDVDFVVDGTVDDDDICIAGVVLTVEVVVVVVVAVVVFTIFIGSHFSMVVPFVSISLFIIPVLHSGTHMTNSIVSCVQMSNGRPFLVNGMRFILLRMKNRAFGQSINKIKNIVRIFIFRLMMKRDSMKTIYCSHLLLSFCFSLNESYLI